MSLRAFHEQPDLESRIVECRCVLTHTLHRKTVSLSHPEAPRLVSIWRRSRRSWRRAELATKSGQKHISNIPSDPAAAQPVKEAPRIPQLNVGCEKPNPFPQSRDGLSTLW